MLNIHLLKFVNIGANQRIPAIYNLDVGTTTPAAVLCTSKIDHRQVFLIDTPPYPSGDDENAAEKLQRWIENR